MVPTTMMTAMTLIALVLANGKPIDDIVGDDYADDNECDDIGDDDDDDDDGGDGDDDDDMHSTSWILMCLVGLEDDLMRLCW